MARPAPHGPLTRVAENVFCMDADADDLERPRRMTLFRLADGRLVVHSGIRLADGELEAIDSLGTVAYYLLVPNPHHDPDAAWFAERYPKARFLAAAPAAEAFRKLVRVDATFEDGWPPELSGVLEHHTVAGIRFVETVFFHVPSRTLVVVDLAFHLTEAHFTGKPLGRLFMKLNDAYDRFGITRLTRMLVRDPTALRASLEQILRWEFDRVIVSHGDLVEGDARRRFRSGFPTYLP